MNQALALRILGQIMDWSDDRAGEEFMWLRLMSRLKYDGYSDFLAGARFVEQLIDWLQQFEPQERDGAYAFVRRHLVYIGPAEMQRLVCLLYPNHVRKRLLRTVAAQHGIQPWQVMTNETSKASFTQRRRSTLFMGLSEGAHLDQFRRANWEWITNEQVVIATQVNDDKWIDLLKDLRESLDDPNAVFSSVWLIDDFVGSGTTLLRNEGTSDDPKWKGKLDRFWHSVAKNLKIILAPDHEVFVHHYIAAEAARSKVESLFKVAKECRGADWFHFVESSYSYVLPDNCLIDQSKHADFWALTDKYYDANLETSHTAKGGTTMERGFAGGKLPLILDHNTPNNSISLLWAETSGAKGKHMRPLFRRRQRHE